MKRDDAMDSTAKKHVDPELDRILSSTDSGKPLVAFLELRRSEGVAATPDTPVPMSAGAFPFAIRREAVENAKKEAEAAYGESFRKLLETGLEIRSPRPAAMVIVQGSVSQLRTALTLDAVVGALADFNIPVDLPEAQPKEPTNVASDSSLVRHIRWIWTNHRHAPISEFVTRLAHAYARTATEPLQVLHEIRARLQTVTSVADEFRPLVEEIAKSLSTRSATLQAEILIRAALADMGAWCATLFIRDPWLAGELRLVLRPGVRYPEPLYGCNSEGTFHKLLAEGKDTEYFEDAAEVSRRQNESPADVVHTPGAGEALQELTKRNALFGSFSERERIRSCVRLLGRQDGDVLFSLWVNFAHAVKFQEYPWLQARLGRLRDELLAIAGDASKELLPPFTVDRFNQLVEPARRLTATARKNPDMSLNDWLAPILEAALEAFRIRESGFATIYLLRPGTRMLEIVAAAGNIQLPPNPVRQSMTKGEGLAAWVALRGGPLLIKDLQHSEFHALYCKIPNQRNLEPVRSVLAVPMMEENRVIGLLNLQSTVAGCFKEESVPIVMHAAHLAALAWQKWDQETMNRERQALLKELFNLLRAVATASTPKAREIIRNDWAKIVCDSMQADYCDLWRWKEPSGRAAPGWQLLATHASAMAQSLNVVVKQQPVPRERGWSEFVVRHKQLVCISFDPEDQGFKPLYWDEVLSQWRRERGVDWAFVPTQVNKLVGERKVQCELGIPILEDEECCGMAWVKYLSHESIPLHDTKLKDWLPGTAAIAIFSLHADRLLAPTVFNMEQVSSIREVSQIISPVLISA